MSSVLGLPDDFCLMSNIDLCPKQNGGWRRCTQQEENKFFASQERILKIGMYTILSIAIIMFAYVLYMALTSQPPLC